MSTRKTRASDQVDHLDLTILDYLLQNGRITFKQLAKATHTDQRTIASRYQRLVKLGILQAVTVQVDWSKVGLNAMAIMGTTTPQGEQERRKLMDYIKSECRVLEGFSAIGSHEYVLRVVDKDISTLRKTIAGPLEPLTASLDTSVVVEKIKSPDYKGLMKYLKNETSKKHQ